MVPFSFLKIPNNPQPRARRISPSITPKAIPALVFASRDDEDEIEDGGVEVGADDAGIELVAIHFRGKRRLKPEIVGDSDDGIIEDVGIDKARRVKYRFWLLKARNLLKSRRNGIRKSPSQNIIN